MMDIHSLKAFHEELEEKTLSPYAMLSKNTKGRDYPINPCYVRTDFIRDRDRIIHCKSFRRLKHKTQVFIAPSGDHYRTRLTHTLEVSQIARTISRSLRLNEDLTEAIALGHDLGHTPFGHVGEDELSSLMNGGFRHNEQSLRVVERLENGCGLNLTYEVRDGILNHRKSGSPHTLEAMAVSLADRIAYVNHDIDDAIRAGAIMQEDLPTHCVQMLGKTHGERINTLICDIISESYMQPFVTMSKKIDECFSELRSFMFDKVYMSPIARGEESKVRNVIRGLFSYYCEKPDSLPDEFSNNIDADGLTRVVADYIACMTDIYAIDTYKELFIPDGMQ